MEECTLISRLTFHLFLLSQVFTVLGSNFYYCDLPINGRPVSIPAQEYAKYCCKASGGGYSRFSCSDRGGCCGDKDAEHCCDLDDISVQLGVGLTFGALVLLGIIALILFCCARSMGEEIYCIGCCECETPPIGQRTEPIRHTIRAVSRMNLRNIDANLPSVEDGLRVDPVQYPSAPYEPEVTSNPPDEAPPSYFEVVENPDIYPETKKTNR